MAHSTCWCKTAITVQPDYRPILPKILSRSDEKFSAPTAGGAGGVAGDRRPPATPPADSAGAGSAGVEGGGRVEVRD